MASCNQQCFLSPRFFLQLMFLSLTMRIPVTESTDTIHLRGQVGGNVTFRFSVLENRKPEFVYFQKGTVYVNGHHSMRNITEPAWQNTRMDRSTNEVHMYGLNISHSGDYQLYIYYSSSEIDVMSIKLYVTGNYSKPLVTALCSNETKSCTVTCSSHGGFPFSNMTWNVAGTENTSNKIWKVLNRTKVQCPQTKLFNSSSAALFNCSGSKLKFTCSVGDVTSDEHSVCPHQDPEDPFGLYVLIAACLMVMVVILGIAGLCWWRCKKRPRGSATGQGVMQELKPNGHLEEIAVLTESQERTEAS